MSSISATARFFISFLEQFTSAELPASNNRNVTNDLFAKSIKLNSATTPAATKGWAAKLAGNQTLDFTALTRTVGQTVNANGLKLQAILVHNLDAANPVVIAKGAANGYAFNGATGNETIPPAGSFQKYFAGGLTAIDATHKTLDITAVGDYQIILIFG
jgi:hypothetical protein